MGQNQNKKMSGPLLLLVMIILQSCGSYPQPPLTPPFRPREDITIETYKFRVAVLDFTDQTKLAGDLVKTLPDRLTTALFKSGRFDLYERGPLRNRPSREVDEFIKELMERRKVDGILTGTVNRFSRPEKSIVFDLRLTSRNEQLMYSEQHTLKFVGRREVEINQEDIQRLADLISKAVPHVGEAKIVNKNGPLVTINMGRAKRLVPGMTGYIEAVLDTVRDPETGEVARPTLIVGEMVINAVEEDSSIARIVSGEDVFIGDIAKFK